MNLQRLKNSRGISLAELIVAMALSSILLGLVTTGSLFLKKYINQWRQHDRLMEELVFIETEFSRIIGQSRRTVVCDDSLVCVDHGLKITVYCWGEGVLLKNGRQLSRSGLSLDKATVSKMDLPLSGRDTILKTEGSTGPSGLYKLIAVVSDSRGNTDSMITLIRSDYEYFKYTPF